MGRKTRVEPPQWSDVRGRLHLKINDAAAELGVSADYLKRLCRKNGVSRWPGKQLRYLKATMGTEATLDVMEESKAKADEYMDGIQQQIVPPLGPHQGHGGNGGELVTLNLIDKVGLPAGGSEGEQ